MQSKERNIFNLVFQIICLFGTITATLWCCYEFSKNEDICEVLFKKLLEDDETVYPDLTIGFPHQLNDTALRIQFGEEINPSLFRTFLQGGHWDDRMLNIKFDDVLDGVHCTLLPVFVTLN